MAGSGKVLGNLLPSMRQLLPAGQGIQPGPLLYDPNRTIHVNANIILNHLKLVLSVESLKGAMGKPGSHVFTHPLHKKEWKRNANGQWVKVISCVCDVDASKVGKIDAGGKMDTCVYAIKGQGYVKAVLGQVTKIIRVLPKDAEKLPHKAQQVQPVVEFGHRLVYWAMMGPPLESQVVMHTCEKKGCLSPRCLVAGTPSANKRKSIHDYGVGQGVKKERMDGFSQRLKDGN
jgi:hypothetical protein